MFFLLLNGFPHLSFVHGLIVVAELVVHLHDLEAIRVHGGPSCHNDCRVHAAVDVLIEEVMEVLQVKGVLPH